jgi:uncharacterized protein (DUF1501 family)
MEHAVFVLAGIHALRRPNMERRAFLTGAAATVLVAGRVWAAPKADLRTLVVFLRGAYDAASVVIPVSSSFYYEARPTIAVPRPHPGAGDAAVPLTPDWGLHPALKDSLLPLWQKKQLAMVPFAGTADDLTRSHFETQDTIELGQPVHGTRNYSSGFMARLAAVLTRTKPIAYTEQLPLVFRGGYGIANIAIGSVGRPGVDDRQAKLIEGMYAHDALGGAVTEGFKVRDDVYKTISQELTAADRGAVSAKGFELSARRIGRLMREEFNLGFVDVGGWDTHVGQGGVTGYLAGRIGELGRALAGFAAEIGPRAWNDTLVVVISEFGRTFRENGNKGTDHGHGSVYWVLGGAVKGGRIAGEQVRLDHATLFQNRDYPVLTDYRAFFGGLFARAYGLELKLVQQVFPGVTPKDLALV